MEAETVKLGRGTPESAAQFRQQLEQLGLSQAGLAQAMVEQGDDRVFDTILRTLRRMAGGGVRVSGKLHAFLDLLRDQRNLRQRLDLLQPSRGGAVLTVVGGEMAASNEALDRARHSQADVHKELRVITEHLAR